MSSFKAAVLHSPEIETFHYPADCPFKTERAAAMLAILASNGNSFFTVEPPRNATRNELLQFHSDEYLHILERVSGGSFTSDDLFYGLGTNDTPVFADLFPYSRLACGASITAAELLLSGEYHYCFNPSGGYHHAYADKAGGFCYLNDVVLACRTLVNAGKRVFCLDLDAHHGNGTQSAFYDNPRVFTVSLHESGKTLFPWAGFESEIGEGEGKGFNVNISLPAGTDDDAYTRIFPQVVPPLIEAYKPDFIVLENGMDILSVDPLTHLSMTNNAIADVLPLLTVTGIPILMVGGGGYNADAVARGWALSWQTVCGVSTDTDLTIGMGGMFLGNAEWHGGLRDMRSYAHTDEKQVIDEQLNRSIAMIRETVFPLHGI
ncbi:MAG: acetoin utilization protein AcuC [Chitinispirillaceae bacterium]|nr:acetoin utilization protein AcuC [Chitinispirillaceae bacterium]